MRIIVKVVAISKNQVNIMELKDRIKYNQGLSELLKNFILNCPNRPNNYTLKDVDIFKINFCRYTMRTMYYADSFVKNLNKIESYFEDQTNITEKNFNTMIPDDIFFDFDAFLFSCKSIVEENMVKRAKGLHDNVKKQFMDYSKVAFETFIKVYLNKLRDEVVHINNFGSAIGSMANFREGRVTIKAFNYSEDIDLKEIFTIVLISMSNIIKNVATIIMLHECYSFGFPTKDITFRSQYGEFKISEFVKIDKSKQGI